MEQIHPRRRMGKIKKGDHFVDVELEAKDFLNLNTPLIPALYNFAWMMLTKKAPKLSEGMQAGRLLVVDDRVVARFYRYAIEAEPDKDKDSKQ